METAPTIAAPARRALPPNIEATYPLTPMQKALLFYSVSAPLESAVYFQQLTWIIRAGLDPALLREAWSRVVHRHAVLRTFFLWEGRKEPLQCVCERVRIPWTEEDWRGFAPLQPERLQEHLAADRRRGFRLNEAPLLRFQLLRLGDEEYRFIWSFHHVMLDGWSLPLLAAEVMAIYRHLKDGAPLALQPPIPYRNFVEANLRQDQAALRERWRRKLAGFAAATSLRQERPAIAVEGGAPHREPVRLSAESTRQLQNCARISRCTVSILVQAAWALLLRVYSGEDDVVFGVTTAGRPENLPGADRIVGLCINTLPARVRARAGDPLSKLLTDLMAQHIEREELGQSSLVEIVAASEVAPGTPLFESIVVFENYLIGPEVNAPGDPLAVHEFASYDRTNYPLALIVVPGERLELALTADSAQYERTAVAAMVRHVADILDAISSAPDAALSELVPPRPEEGRALREMNRTGIDWDLSTPLDARLESLAADSPRGVALVVPHAGGSTTVTWAELNRRANRLGHWLRAQSIEPDGPVGVCMERSIEMVVALFAIVKAGAAYVPLDPENPPERLRSMVENVRPRVVLTQGRLRALAGDLTGAQVVAVDDASTAFEHLPDGNLPRLHRPDHLIYIIHTSGSTGRPKGAMNTHRSVLNRLLWMQQAYPLTPADCLLQKTPFSFDVSVWEFFWPLLNGARLVVAEPGGHRDPAYLIRTIQAQAVTTIHFVPSMLRMFLEAPGVERCDSLRRVICSGEALPPDLAALFFERFGARVELHNLYGPTECAVDVTAWPCAPAVGQVSVPIGRPIANTEIHILDRDLRPLPIGVPGELYIGGLNVGRGYWNSPALTAEKFLPDPFSHRPGARLYRTGDLARRKADGVIEYLDRLDFQVKIRGFRIELGEIEARLAELPGIRAGAVVAAGAGPEKRLIAYLCAGEPRPAVAELRRRLREQLPEYMLPSHFVFLPELPLSPNGKLDRRRLPAPEAAHLVDSAQVALPQSEAERNIADAWREVLQVPRVGLHDNFFELGGNSLLLLPVQFRLQRLFKKTIPMTLLFRAPTVQALAELLTDDPAPVQPAENGARQRPPDRTQRLRELRMASRAGAAEEDAN